MSKQVLFALLCMAAAGSACAHVFKSVGADGKVVYSDHPADNNVAVSVIKADVVQSVPMEAGATPGAEGALRQAVLRAMASGTAVASAPKDGAHKVPSTKKTCDKMVNIVVDSKGELLKILPPKSFLSGFKTN
jgi:hypothetical protein